MLIRDMMRKPDDYTITCRFVTGLPTDMRDAMFEDRLNVEVNTLDEFVESAKAYKVTERSKKEYSQNTHLAPPIKDKLSNRPSNNKDHMTPLNRPICGRMFIHNVTGSPQPTPQQHPNDVMRARPPKPSDMSHIKCYRCREMGHYTSHHDKDNNPQIRAAHTTIRDDVHEGMNDDDSMVENGPSDIEDGYEQANWQEVEFEEYGGEYDSGDDNEFMGMARECDGSIDPYDGSDESSSGYDKEYSSSDEIEHIRYQTRYLTTQDFGQDTPCPNYQHIIHIAHDPRERVSAMMTDRIEDRRTSRYKLKITTEPKERPVYSAADKMCLSTYTQVNGILALTLWDSGSTSMAMSPHFADVSKALVFNLVDPVTLQLGMVGSRSKINFGMIADMELVGLTINEYINVVNIDRYDLLIGTPFMHQHNVMLDFEQNCIHINGTEIPAEVIPTTTNIHDARQHRLTAIEVLDGGEMGKTVNPLPEDSLALLMTEEEYIIGDKVDITPATEPHSVPTKVKAEAPMSTVCDATMEYECQPTSSKVLVEDMITDDDDDAHEHHFHIDIDFSNQTPHEVRFWDCPVPIPKVKWPGDSRMPMEWNLMVGEMWEIDPTSQGSLFNYLDFPYSDDPETDINDCLSFIVPNSELESKGPYEFTSDMYPDDR
ncbi:hypothetical protein EDD18DRAFT_1364444 [Armillaria luteobubalina]|uniref:CCHC-type domain-containing protein n=1 Tax=Armillaria luteobubalina TaxID=153913 RepID=A0AA39P7Z9_9AGAR|nr:hypothetical protein EDD18DRAFT_1364444 [Armillaria luteobubalina]